MISVLLSGFATGLLLQIAIGPVFFFILNIVLQKTLEDGLLAVLAVTLVDYFFIALAVVGVGKLLERPKIKFALGITSSLVLIVFGTLMILSVHQTSHLNIPDALPNTMIKSSYLSSFIAAFLLTISSPLTIVFWTGLFAARALEKGYTRKQLVLFGFAAGSATFLFLGLSVTLLSMLRTSAPELIQLKLLWIMNFAVGSLLIVYGIIRLCGILTAARAKKMPSHS